jgi:hypothetical protein
MKFELFGYIITANIFKARHAKPALTGDYFSRSRNITLPIREMGLDYMRNALLKELGLSEWKYLESEKIVEQLTDYPFPNSESYSLYNEMKRRVTGQ